MSDDIQFVKKVYASDAMPDKWVAIFRFPISSITRTHWEMLKAQVESALAESS